MIISAADRNRFNCHINHSAYAKANNVEYKFYDSLKIKEHFNFMKIYAILDAFNKADHVLYLDDDAFFTNVFWNYKSIFESNPGDIIVAESPRRNEGKTPIFNSGVIFLRRTPEVINLLNNVLEIGEIRGNNDYEWKTSWGSAVGGDQDTLIYLTQTKYKGIASIIEQTKINARPYDYDTILHPIVHFAGKQKPIELFCKNVCDIYNINM